MKILCDKTHERISEGGKCTFRKGSWYELTAHEYYETDVVGYYTITHPKKGKFNVSRVFLNSRFVTPAKWREIQIDSILSDD